MKPVSILKTFFERDDQYAPGGGRELTTKELLEFRKANPQGYTELVELAAKELGVQVETATV